MRRWLVDAGWRKRVRTLDPAAPRASPLPHSEWKDSMELVDLHRVAPQSRFNIHAAINAYMREEFPAELFMTI